MMKVTKMALAAFMASSMSVVAAQPADRLEAMQAARLMVSHQYVIAVIRQSQGTFTAEHVERSTQVAEVAARQVMGVSAEVHNLDATGQDARAHNLRTEAILLHRDIEALLVQVGHRPLSELLVATQ